VAGENCETRSLIIFTLHQTLLGVQANKDEMGEACSTEWRDKKFVQNEVNGPLKEVA
jgi:hypothetical protein